MLRLVFDNGSDIGGEAIWYVGDPAPTEPDPAQWRPGSVAVGLIVEVEASGGELEWIYRNIQGLPAMVKDKKSVRWFGDHAKFIVANL